MKKKLTIYSILLLMTTVVIGSCGGGGDDDPEPPTPPTPTNPTTPDKPSTPVTPPDTTTLKVSVSETQIAISPNGSTQTVTITTEGTWTAESDVVWCRVTKNGSQLTIIIDENTQAASRTAHVTIVATKGDKSNAQVITITQPGATPPPDDPTPDDPTPDDPTPDDPTPDDPTPDDPTPQSDITFRFNSDTLTVSDAPWPGLETRSKTIYIITTLESIDGVTVTSDQGADEWCHLKGFSYFTENNGPTNLNCHYKVEVDDNLTSVQRITRLTFTKDGAELGHCYVLQKPKPRIGVYFPQGKTFPASGGTLIARVFCNTDWYASAYGSWTGFDWVTCEKVDDTTLRLIATPRKVGEEDQRSITLQVTAGTTMQTYWLVDGEGTAPENYGYGEPSPWD